MEFLVQLHLPFPSTVNALDGLNFLSLIEKSRNVLWSRAADLKFAGIILIVEVQTVDVAEVGG